MSKQAKTNAAEAISTTRTTEAGILTDAERMGDEFTRVPYPTVALLAEAREMELAKPDLPDLVQRGYDISAESFERLAMLALLLGPNGIRAILPEKRVKRTEVAEESREKLLAIREQLALIGEAGGVDAADFVLDTRRYDVLVDSVATVLQNVKANRAKMADKKRVDALVAQAAALIQIEMTSRLDGSVIAAQRSELTRRVHQIKRMLYDQMRHISKQGLAAYPGDPVRGVYYRLDRLTSPTRKPVDATDPPSLESDEETA